MASSNWPARPETKPPYLKPDSCKTCPLYGTGRGFGFPDIGGTNGVLVVVEALGEHEAQDGGPLVGPAGWQFNHVLKRGGFKREDFAGIDNVLHCRPPQNKLIGQSYEHNAIHHCEHFLRSTIDAVQPRAILAMGNIPLREMAGQAGISKNRGFIFEGVQGIPVVGTYHPSFLLPRKGEKSAAKYTWVVIMDMRKAIRVAAGKRELVPQHYLMDPSIDVARQFMREYEATPDVYLAWDLETLYKMNNPSEADLKLEGEQPVTRISFSFRPGYAMSIPYNAMYRDEIVIPLMAMNRPKVGHNDSSFDRPIMRFQEHIEINGELHDNRYAFHTFQPNIETNLAFVASILTDHIPPWKHLSQSDPPFYSCVDADATITSFLRLMTIMRETEIPEYADAHIG